MTNQTPQQFESAVRLYAAAPNAETLLNLNRHALPLMTALREPAWKPVDSPDAFTESFSRIRVVADRRLDVDESLRLAGCLAYALRASLAGDDMGQPEVSYAVAEGGATFTVVEADYDGDSSIRTEPDPAEAFALARLYIFQGTPLRKTNRVAPCGTRLVEGVAPCNITIYVR